MNCGMAGAPSLLTQLGLGAWGDPFKLSEPGRLGLAWVHTLENGPGGGGRSPLSDLGLVLTCVHTLRYGARSLPP